MPELNAKILIVYGDENVRESLTTLMEREGFRTLQANNGKMGLDVIRTASPDLMLVEIKMSDVDGINLLRQAKDLDPNLLIIAITAYCDSYSATRALEVGPMTTERNLFRFGRLPGRFSRHCPSRNLRIKLKPSQLKGNLLQYKLA